MLFPEPAGTCLALFTSCAANSWQRRLCALISKSALLTFVLLLANPAVADEMDGPLHAVPGKPPAADFSLEDIDGNSHRLADYRGKVVVLNFWATWCPPCRFEMPSMQSAWENLRDENIVFLAINIGEDEDTIFTFTADYPVDFPLLLDRDSTVIQQWQVRGLPTTFVIDPRGRVVYRAVGGRNWDSAGFAAALRELLKKD